jgi:hypothetical protein
MTTTSNREGMRASPTRGTYRSRVQGVGTDVVSPPMRTNGPSVRDAKPSVMAVQKRKGRNPVRRQANRITATATYETEATSSA